jgi:TfoX/Sxy family transcriptional regulator of competence genes
MDFEKTSLELFHVIGNALAGYACESKKMFGAMAYFVHGNMFAGAHKRDLFLRLSLDDQKEIKKEYDEVANFEPMQGRPMSQYVVIPESVFSQPGMLGKWVDKSYGYALCLPVKKKKKDAKTME